MYNVLSLGYEFLSEFIPFIIVLLLIRRGHGKWTSSFSKCQYILPVIFALYIIAVFYVTAPGTIYDAMTVNFERMKEHINLVPFSGKIDLLGYVLNLVMFVPLGFLVPLIWKKTGKSLYIFLIGFAFSCLIEISQLLCSRGTDVDDLILNTLGAVVGFLVYKIWTWLTKSRFQLDSVAPIEMPVYILAIYFGRFLFFNRLGLIKLIYGY